MCKDYDFAVVFGGISNEHEVSVITGTMACNVLKKAGKSVLPVYINRLGEMTAGEEGADISIYRQGSSVRLNGACVCGGGMVLFDKKGRPKRKVNVGCALNCCHGGLGEGGGIAGAFLSCNIPFASAGLFGSAAFMDKFYTKLILQGLGVNVAKYGYSRDTAGAIAAAEELGYPVIVKPVKLGSSVGVAKAENEEELLSALETAFLLDDGVLIEEYISPRREVNCAAYFADGQVITSPCEEVFTHGDVLSYDDKYREGGGRKCPAELPDGMAEFIRGETARVYSALNMRGIVRFDYIIRGEDALVSEINTVPGSLSQYLLSGSYASFAEVLEQVAEQARADAAELNKKLVIETGILNNLNTNACKSKR